MLKYHFITYPTVAKVHYFVLTFGEKPENGQSSYDYWSIILGFMVNRPMLFQGKMKRLKSKIATRIEREL